MREMRNIIIILVEKSDWISLLAIPSHRWKVNIETDQTKIVSRLHSCGLTYGPMTGFCKYVNESLCCIQKGKFLDYLGDCQNLNKKFICGVTWFI